MSFDPYMRGRMGGRPSSHPPFPLDQPLCGDGVGRVVQSQHPGFQIGDIVCGHLHWAEYSVLLGAALRKISTDTVSVTQALSVLGMPALTAYFGLLDIGKPQAGPHLQKQMLMKGMHVLNWLRKLGGFYWETRGTFALNYRINLSRVMNQEFYQTICENSF
jgi:hypothetical protein